MLLVISGPSGAGKTTIAHRIEKLLGGVFSVSLTTRPQSAKDVQGVDYDFVTREEFIKHRDAGELLEWAEVFGNFYGTPKSPVDKALASGKLMILEIDVQGATQIKRKMPDAYALFILPPSENILLDRLRQRQREDESVIQRRFAKAKDEIAKAQTSNVYNAFVVNDDLERAVAQAADLINADRSRRV